MIKHWIYTLIVLCLLSCDTDSGWDCVQSAGSTIERIVEVPEFSKILVNRDVALVLTQGPDIEVKIVSGENLMGDIEAVVVGDRLEITDHNSCNLVRDYGLTTVYVSAPNITEIRSSTQFDIRSNGLLNFESLRLNSEDFNAPGSFTVGDFRLEVAVQDLSITANNLASFYITGTAQDLDIGFYAGAGRFEGANLMAQNISIFHRGSNDMILNPVASLVGEMVGPGDVIVVNTPPLVEVAVLYTGDLIFQD